MDVAAADSVTGTVTVVFLCVSVTVRLPTETVGATGATGGTTGATTTAGDATGAVVVVLEARNWASSVRTRKEVYVATPDSLTRPKRPSPTPALKPKLTPKVPLTVMLADAPLRVTIRV